MASQRKLLSWYTGLTILVLFNLCLVYQANASAEIRQRSVECGQNPMILLLERYRASSFTEILRIVRDDPAMKAAMQLLLRKYDDCIRAADGLHYKRSYGILSELSPSPPTSQKSLMNLQSIYDGM